jgi:type III restriction enzyme
VCEGGTYPAQVLYLDLADRACVLITAGITQAHSDKKPIKALLRDYDPTGSTRHVRFSTSKQDRWDTSGPPPKNHVNWVILDSDWEAEFCRVAEAHPKVVAYTKNHSLGFEVPYRDGSLSRHYRPDFIVLVDDGRGPDNLRHVVVEIKGYRREDAKAKKLAMDKYWIPGVNNLESYGRWTFVELTDVSTMDSKFAALIDAWTRESKETS